VTISDNSGRNNHGRFYYSTGSSHSSSSWRQEDVPWVKRQGVHQFSVRLGTFYGRQRGTTGWDKDYKRGDRHPYLRADTSLTVTESNGAIKTGQAAWQVFGQSYTTMAWFKPAREMLEKGAGTRDVIALIDLSGQETLAYRWEDGKLAWEVNARDEPSAQQSDGSYIGGANADIQMRSIKANLITRNDWYHIAISRDVQNRKPAKNKGYR
jgi:hypothetical protein